MKKLKSVIIIAMAFVSSSCSNNGLEIYTDESVGYLQMNIPPEVYVAVNKEKGFYYRVINIHSDWTVDMGVAPALYVSHGYHIADRKSYGGYDLDRTYKSLNSALEAAESAGDVYKFVLGEGYQYQGKSLLNTRTFSKLEKQ